MAAVGSVILFVLWVAIVLLLARFVLDWVQLLARNWRPQGAVAALCEAIYTITDPPLRAVRGVIPRQCVAGPRP
jgi:YggT family protein